MRLVEENLSPDNVNSYMQYTVTKQLDEEKRYKKKKTYVVVHDNEDDRAIEYLHTLSTPLFERLYLHRYFNNNP